MKVSDATTKALAVLLKGLPKGVLHVRDGLAAWLLNLQRYGGGNDRPFWLKAYVGGPFTVDRLRNPVPLFIPRLAVATFGAIQPDRLEQCLTGADDGLAGRFLWTWPEAIPFLRPTQSGESQAAATRLQRLADLTMPFGEGGEPCPSYVSLDGPAADQLERFGQAMQAAEVSAQGLLQTSIGEARGQVLRLALVLEFVRWCADGRGRPGPAMVGLEAFEAAERLMLIYFLPMAARVLGNAIVPVEERNARTLAEWIMRERPTVVNVSSIRDGARLPGLRESASVKEACSFLAGARWLIAVRETGAETPGLGRRRCRATLPGRSSARAEFRVMSALLKCRLRDLPLRPQPRRIFVAPGVTKNLSPRSMRVGQTASSNPSCPASRTKNSIVMWAHKWAARPPTS